jgi:o-succinylbenzoate synthase
VPVRDRIAVNCTVPAVGPDQAADIVRRSGCLTAKVKVAEKGQTIAQDIERVEAVRDAIGPRGQVRVDANGGWSVDSAVSAIASLNIAAHGLEYVEQPCASVEDLAADPLRVVELGAADIAVLKVAPLGGVRACLRIAEQIGLPVVVSSAVDSSIGLAAGLALAAALPELPYACGLATTSLLDGDVVAEPLVPVGGFLPVGRQALDEAAFAQVAADAETDARWQARLAAVQEVLG